MDEKSFGVKIKIPSWFERLTIIKVIFVFQFVSVYFYEFRRRFGLVQKSNMKKIGFFLKKNKSDF